MISLPLVDKYVSFSDPRSKKSPNRSRSSNQQPCSCAHFLSLTSWTDLQAVVPARASISSRTRCATADALSNKPYSPTFLHSPSCGIRSELSPSITVFIRLRCKDTKYFLNFQNFQSKLFKERRCYCFLFYSIGRIIDSMNWISSSVSPYFLYSSSSVQGFEKSWRGTNM